MRLIWRLTLPWLACGAWAAQNGATVNSYTQTNLSSDIPGMAVTTDSLLVNPWGLSKPTSATVKEAHWWAADEHTGVSTLYDANGAIPPLTITVPPASGTGTGSPTGTVAIGNNFVFVTEDGTISEWVASLGPALSGPALMRPAAGFVHPRDAAQTCASCHVTTATVMVNRAANGAVYTGVTLANVSGTQELFVANAAGGVEAFDTSFHPVTLGPGAFTDPNIPAGFAPYGIQAIGKRIYVTFAPPPPASGGYVDAFDTTGKLLLALQTGSWLNGPWGIAQAPANFGAFSNALLVGNVGSGVIAAYNPSTGKFAGVLKDSSGKAITNVGLWAIAFGAGNADSGPTNVLYFNAGIQNFTHGLFGSVAAN